MNKFVTKMIVNVIMLTRLNENVNKIPFLDINVSNILLDENAKIFYWMKMSVIFFFTKILVRFIRPKCQQVTIIA